MRSITEGEAVAIRALLAAQPITEKERSRQTWLGSRTFERIRKRAYSEKWVFDRFVPDPSRTGFETVYFAVAQPHAEHLEGIQDQWKESPSNILLWRWPETIFGIFFSKDPTTDLLAGLNDAEGRSEAFVVAVPAKQSKIPVYFDFEAAWVRFTEQRGTLTYPHPLPATGSKDRDSSGGQGLNQEIIAKLLSRPFRPGAENLPLHVNRFFLPRSQKKLLETGALEQRAILDPQKTPPFQGRSIERIAFVLAELTSPGTEEALFRLLMAIRVTPFLFASDGSQVLLATLSPAPTGIRPGTGHPAILRNLQRFLKDIRIVREPISDLSVLVNHRYDRLFLSAA